MKKIKNQLYISTEIHRYLCEQGIGFLSDSNIMNGVSFISNEMKNYGYYFILMILRFKEAWSIWLVNNIINLTIWIIIVAQGGNNSVMMLFVAIGYFFINILGIYKWNKKTK